MNKKTLNIILILLFTCAIVVAGIMLPRYFIDKQVQNSLSVVQSAPAEYYLASSTIMAKKASEQLSIIDRIKLISGTWESTVSSCPTSEATLSELEAASLAKEQLMQMYKLGVYPFSLDSTYNNWYSWEAELYKYTDNVFSTYTVYLWCIKYIKYDSSLTHTIYMTEDGTICLANASENATTKNKIDIAYSNWALEKTLRTPNLKVTKRTTSSGTPQVTYPNLALDNVEFSNIYVLTIEDINTSGDYYIFQYENSDNTGIGIWAK